MPQRQVARMPHLILFLSHIRSIISLMTLYTEIIEYTEILRKNNSLCKINSLTSEQLIWLISLIHSQFWSLRLQMRTNVV